MERPGMSFDDEEYWAIIDSNFSCVERNQLYVVAKNAMDSDSFSKHYTVLDGERPADLFDDSYPDAPQWEDFS